MTQFIKDDVAIGVVSDAEVIAIQRPVCEEHSQVARGEHQMHEAHSQISKLICVVIKSTNMTNSS